MSRSRIMLKMAEASLDHEPTEDEVRDVYVLGWVMELIQFAILTSDDIVDEDVWRRGRWAWHCQPGVGHSAVFDSFVGAFVALAFLKKQLGKHPAYLDMVESINHEILFVQLYQSFEATIASHGPGNVGTFCSHKLRDRLLGLSGYFYLPLSLILHWLGRASPENLDETRKITDQLAIYFQSQNDFLDLYGTPSQSGKSGSDIKGNKCSWLIVEALKICNDSQRDVLKDKYGRGDQESVDAVKQVFEDLDMAQKFQAYKTNTLGDIKKSIESLDESAGLKREVFMYYLSLLVIA